MSHSNDNSELSRKSAGFTIAEIVVAMAVSAVLFAGILSGVTFLGRNLTRLVNGRDQDEKSRQCLHLLGQDINSAIYLYEVTPSKIALVLPIKVPAGRQSGRIDSFSESVLTSISAGWTSNLANPASPWIVQITSGRAAGRLLKILSNTSSSLTVTEFAPFGAPAIPVDLNTIGLVAGTDTFELANLVTYTYVPPSSENAGSGKLTRLDGTRSSDVLTDLTRLVFTYYNQSANPLTVGTGEADLTKSSIQSVKQIELSFATSLGNATSGTLAAFEGNSPRLVVRNRALLQ